MTDWQPLRDEIESLLGGDPVTMFRSGIASERGEPIIFFRDGGKLQALRLADGKFGRDMLQAMTMLQRGPQGLWVNMLGRAGALLRTGITSSPPFILANFVRDQVSSMVMYGKPFKRLTATFGGMASELFQRDAARRYTAAGGVMGGANTAAFHDMHIRADLRRLGRKGFMAQRATWKGVLEMTELSETGMRSGLFKTFREEAMKRGLDDIEATFEAAWRARDHIDFNRRGSAMAAVSRVVPFLNASLQGLDKFQRHFLLPFFTDTGEPAARALAVKSWARLSALMAAGMGLHALMSEHEEYLDLDARTRASHWAVKLGDRWLFIPKPFEMAAFLNLAEAGYDAMARQDPRWKEWFMSSLYEVSMPPNVMQGNPAVKTAYEYATGRDLSTGSDIVPDQYKGLEPWLQHTAKTSSLSEAIGKVFNVSPLMVDHMIVSFGGSMGRDLLSGYDYALSDKPLPGWDEFAMTRRFIKDGSRNARSTRAFWDLVGSRTGLLENARRSYQEMIDAGDPAAAAEFLSSQSSMAQDWIAAGSLPADARRIHPLTRAQSAVKAINDLRRDIAKGQITTANGTVEVNRVERGAADDILEDMAAMEGRNALVLMGVPGWETRQLLDPAGYERELAATSPGLAQALADRYASGHVLPFGKMQKLWPVLQQRIRRDGSAAPVSDLAAAVRAARPEMGGQKLQTRKRAVVPGDVP